MSRLFGAEARASIASATPQPIHRVRVGPYAAEEKLLYHLRCNRGKLPWAVNSYFREACVAPDPDYEPRFQLQHQTLRCTSCPEGFAQERQVPAGDTKHTEEAPSPTPFVSLPAALLEQVLCRCDPVTVCSAALACKPLARASASNQVWRALYQDRWGRPPANSAVPGCAELTAAEGSAEQEGGSGTDDARLAEGRFRSAFRDRLKFEMEMRCLKCGNEKVVPLVFGFPSTALVERMRAGGVVLGGDYLADGEPTREPCWSCLSCGVKYTRFPYAHVPP
uniref:F-box domain-containing protein n=1 Tax=Tetraselmis sp. GSL018 TaxID=582737 RepID=A0A061QQ85_9CHLO